MSKREPSGDAQAAVHVSDGQGVLVGTGGTQINNWGQKPPLDPSWLSALNPHTAVARLQQLTHDDLVDFFARATPESVAEIFAAFLEADEAKVIASLADINPRKANELIATLPKAQAFLVALPKAAEAIARKAASLRWTDGAPLELRGEHEPMPLSLFGDHAASCGFAGLASLMVGGALWRVPWSPGFLTR